MARDKSVIGPYAMLKGAALFITNIDAGPPLTQHRGVSTPQLFPNFSYPIADELRYETGIRMAFWPPIADFNDRATFLSVGFLLVNGGHNVRPLLDEFLQIECDIDRCGRLLCPGKQLSLPS